MVSSIYQVGDDMAAVKKGFYEFDPNSIKVIRQKLNLKQSDLAQMLGETTTKTTISRWENSETTPDAKSLAAIYSIAVQGGIRPEFFKKPVTRLDAHGLSSLGTFKIGDQHLLISRKLVI